MLNFIIDMIKSFFTYFFIGIVTTLLFWFVIGNIMLTMLFLLMKVLGI